MGIVCLVIIGRDNLPGGNFINHEDNKKEIVAGRSASHNDAERLIGIARKEIGVRESGHNSGTRVNEYLAYVGFKEAAPWCAAYLSWCFGQAGLTQPRTAWSPGLFPVSRLARDGLPGMLIGIYFPSLGRIGHCGLIERVKGSLIFSIEGNTNVAGSREGDAVMLKARHKRSIAKYSDWL